MRLFAAIVPPDEILEEVVRVVQRVQDRAPESPPVKARRLFAGRGSQAAAQMSTGPSRAAQLERPDPDRMYIPITSFGNVTLGDSVKLAKALRAECATWRPPQVRFTGGAALEFPGDESVWVKLAGDVDDLMSVGRGVPQLVQRLGFFVDRRQFRPWLSVGTITDQSSAPYLQEVVDALDELQGREWSMDHVALMQRPPEAGTSDLYELMEDMPLSGD